MTQPLSVILCLVFLSAGTAFGQAYLMNGSPITDCSGTFYDSGGQAGNYGNNQNLTTTICSDGLGGTHVRLEFSGADLASGDEICFYDGTNLAAPLLSCSGDYQPGAPFVVQATAVNASGCLTVTFNSDAGGTATGWAAVIACVPSCQTVLADLVSTNPAAIPTDTGWIDICPGERVFFNGAGVYPQNNFAYPQSDLTTVFEWSFGDGDISYGPNTSHRYEEPGGYYVQLVLTDNQGCRSTNIINQRVRVAPKPSFALTTVIDYSICAGDTIRLSAGFDSATVATLLVLPESSAFDAGGSRSDSLALPDGTGIPYETSIFFTEFSPGQVLTNASDLESICVNMEHSWMRDLEISISCPNGQSIVLHNFGGQTGSQVYLGIPNDNDLFNPVPGSGYDYCWAMNAPNPTWLTYANTILAGGGTLPAGDYLPFEPFSDLLGCPLNGEWTITATDLWPFDNGFIFSWEINFKNTLYPDIEVFTPNFSSWNWNSHPSIFFSTPDSIAAAPQNGGTAGYTFTVNDDFGCTWDTLVAFPILPFTHPDCHLCSENYLALHDTSVCIGQPVALNAASLDQDTFELRFEAFPNYKFGNANHPHGNPYASSIAVNSLGYNTLTNPIVQIASVCMDIETDFAADLNIYLRAPDGKQLELSTGNGAAGDNYKITCFTPSATNLIVGNTAPFNGTFKPEGNWANLNDAQVEGDWKLVVSDGFGPTQFGAVKWWSIAFNYFNDVTYSWTNAASLSCNNCPNTVATPSSTTTYTLTATDKFNCQHLDTVTVDMSTLFPAPKGLGIISMNGNTMTWGWNAVPGATGYEVNVNNGGWMPPNGALSHTITGLSSGDVVFIQVRAIGGGPNCPPDVAAASAPFFVCDLVATLSSIQPTLCNGTATGSAVISVTNFTAPLQFFANGQPPAYPDGNLMNVFPAGNNFVIVVDSANCRDTVFFNISEPSPIDITTSVTNAICNGDPDGSASASATGGTGNFTFAWQGCLGGAVINGATATGLYAGCYAVTATDANGCTAVDTAFVGEPAAFDFDNSSQTPVSCFGGSDGTASIELTGGTPPYQFVWDNGDTGNFADSLDAGFHFVTVTDDAGCQAATFVQVLEPALLVVDSITAKDASCFGGNNGTATVFAAGGTAPYTFLWNDTQTQTTQKALGLPPGNYSVTVTDSKNCTAQAAVTVDSPPDLTISFINVVNEQCAGECGGAATVQATGGTGPYNYFWDDPTLPDGVPTVGNLCPGSYLVTIQDFNGCTKTDKVNIEPAVPIDVHFDVIPPTCAGFSDGSIFVTIGGGEPPYQVQWSNGTTGPGISNLPCGSYFVTLTDSAGCVTTSTILLNCPDSILITNTVVQAVKCFGGNDGQISVQAQGGTGTLTFQWSDPNMQSGATATNLLAGTYTVTVTDGNGCTATSTAQVGQPSLLAVSIAKTDVTCFGGADGSATASVIGGTEPYQYFWNWTQNGQTITNLPAGNYVVTVSDANNCTGTANVDVTQPPTPVQVFASQTRISCFGENNGEAFALATGGNGEPFTYQWSNGQTGQTTTGLSGGNLSVTATDSKGCAAVQSIEIQQLEKIDVGVAFVPPTCFGRSDGQAAINLVTGGAGMGDTTLYNYQWSVPNSPNAIFINGLAGNQTYSVTATDFEGCSGSHTFFITEPLQISPQIDIQNVSCFGLSDGSAEVVGIQNAALPVVYTWSDGTSGTLIDSLAAGTYILDMLDAKGCTESDTIVITRPDLLEVTFDVQALVCSNDNNAVITANITGGTPEYTLLWSNGATTAQIGGLGPGVYSLQIADKNGCELADSVFIIRPDSLEITSEKTDPQCFGAKNGRIRLLVTGGQMPFRYAINGCAFGGSSTFVGLGAGVYDFQIKDGKGCISTFTDSLGQPPQVGVSLGLDTTITLGDSLLISADVSNTVGMVEYEWRSFLLENFVCVDTPECSMIQVKPYQTNTYVVEVTDENGCRGEARVTVAVDKPRGVFVPTGFSPNGDLNNDLLVVYGKSRQIQKVVTFNVYDRWGELVYQDQNFLPNDDTRGWDGSFRGKECDPGVFVWYVEVEYLDGFREAMKGDVTLIR